MYVGLIIGIGLIVYCFIKIYHLFKLKRYGTQSQGVVVRQQGLPGRKQPIISYYDTEGIMHELKVGLATSHTWSKPVYETGENLPILYLQGRPTTAEPDTAKYRLYSIGMPAFGGVFFLSVAFLQIFL